MTDRLKTLGDSYDSSSERRCRTSSGEGGEALCAPGWGGNEGLTRGPPHAYVAVNASVAWSKPLNVGQNSLSPAQVLKVNGFNS